MPEPRSSPRSSARSATAAALVSPWCRRSSPSTGSSSPSRRVRRGGRSSACGSAADSGLLRLRLYGRLELLLADDRVQFTEPLGDRRVLHQRAHRDLAEDRKTQLEGVLALVLRRVPELRPTRLG